MALWLFKEEPSHYSYADLERDGKAVWEGVTNALALIHLRAVKPGDRILYYHTGKEKAIVAEAEAVKGPAGQVIVAPVRRFAKPVPLATIKADPAFKTWELVRNSRLSVMPVPPELWQQIEKLAAS